MVVAGSGVGGAGAEVGPGGVCPGGPDGFSPGGPPLTIEVEQLETVAVVAVVVVLMTVTVLV